MVGRHLLELGRGQVVGQRVRQHEVAVRQPLHQRAGAQAVGAVVGEVGLARHEEPGNRALQVVVDPQPAHRVVRRRVDAHRHLVGVLARDVLVHVEEVAVAIADDLFAQALDRVGKVQVDAVLHRADAQAVVDLALGGTRRDIARRQVAIGGIHLLQVVVAILFRNLVHRPRLVGLARHPDAAVVAQRFAHQRQLGLVLACRGDAGGVNLRVARVGKVRPALVRAPDGASCCSPWRWSTGRRRCCSRPSPARPRRPCAP